MTEDAELKELVRDFLGGLLTWAGFMEMDEGDSGTPSPSEYRLPRDVAVKMFCGTEEVEPEQIEGRIYGNEGRIKIVCSTGKIRPRGDYYFVPDYPVVSCPLGLGVAVISERTYYYGSAIARWARTLDDKHWGIRVELTGGRSVGAEEEPPVVGSYVPNSNPKLIEIDIALLK